MSNNIGSMPFPEHAPLTAHQDESQARRELAACYRLFDHLGWAEAIFNHITLRVPGPSGALHYLINDFGLHYAEIRSDNLLKVDAQGGLVGEGGEVNRAGFVIHSAIHLARADAHCVAHVHTTAGSAVACKESGLRHDNFYSAMLVGDVGYHPYEGVTTRADEGERLVRSLGACSHLILRHHGLLTVGRTVAEAFMRLWILQRACEIQLASDAGAGPNGTIAPEILERVPSTRLGAQNQLRQAQRVFDAMLRRAGIERACL